MEWVTCLKQAIDYMEEHLLEPISTEQMAEQIAEQIHMSSFYFQKRFQLVTGYSVGEYLKNRRLYEAACELSSKDRKVIDIALKYGYDTPESFSKAFRRFHGITPTEARKRTIPIKQFLPLRLQISFQGGSKMDYYYEEMDKFTLIGFEGTFSFPSSYERIPEFCNEVRSKYFSNFFSGNNPTNEYEQAIADYGIGKYGAVIHDIEKGKFRYLMAGMYQGGPVPKGMVLHTFEASGWVKFKCRGPSPDAIQRLNTQIFQEWLSWNTEYELTGQYNIEWYRDGDFKAEDYESGIWIPAKKV